ncbi:MAG: alkaline phosphatase D family protein [Actinobacteria bacterium]|nr:alkaline phosphatase D family protein [Actinomycetota bacterium]
MNGNEVQGTVGAADGTRWSSMITRRAVLAGMAAFGLAACVPRGVWRGVGNVIGAPDPDPVDGMPSGLFALGVASGDPQPTGVVLWTRLAPTPSVIGGGMPADDVLVRWQLATDDQFQDLVADGVVQTSVAVAHSVHIEVDGLSPDTTYHYRFTTGGQVSQVGRTRTAPAADAEVDELRMVFATCQEYQQGFYTAWSHAAAEDPDVVVFLGDYIYEGGISSNKPRQHNSSQVRTLDAYRARYGLYKSDPRLQSAHRVAPWILIWDDHEVVNNYAGTLPESGVASEDFIARRTAAYQAYWEHQPIRSRPVDGGLQMYRSLGWGTLVDFIAIDGRQYRSEAACGGGFALDCEQRSDPSRTYLGAEQRAWLDDRLASSTARWTVLVNPQVMTPMPIGTGWVMDQWDGFPAERSHVVGQLAQVRNAVVLTGDIHAAGVGHVRDEPAGSPTVATELITTSISSTPTGTEAAVLNQVVNSLEQFPWFDNTKRGYARATITPDHLDVDFVATDVTTDVLGPLTVETSWRIVDGTPGAVPRP